MPRRDGPCKSISDPWRNNSSRLIQSFGPDAGTDSIGDWPQAERMGHFLDRLDSENALPKTIVYNNNPSDNFTVATMLGNFQREVPGKMQFGSGWWHLDQRDGMEEQLKTLANLGLLSDSWACSRIRVPSFPSPATNIFGEFCATCWESG